MSLEAQLAASKDRFTAAKTDLAQAEARLTLQRKELDEADVNYRRLQGAHQAVYNYEFLKAIDERRQNADDSWRHQGYQIIMDLKTAGGGLCLAYAEGEHKLDKYQIDRIFNVNPRTACISELDLREYKPAQVLASLPDGMAKNVVSVIIDQLGDLRYYSEDGVAGCRDEAGAPLSPAAQEEKFADLLQAVCTPENDRFFEQLKANGLNLPAKAPVVGGSEVPIPNPAAIIDGNGNVVGERADYHISRARNPHLDCTRSYSGSIKGMSPEIFRACL